MARAMAMAVAVIRLEHVLGADLHENQLLLKNVVLGLFWSFLDLLDLKNGSGSKFYARKWYRDLWKPKFKTFRCIFMISWHPYMDYKNYFVHGIKRISSAGPKTRPVKSLPEVVFF